MSYYYSSSLKVSGVGTWADGITFNLLFVNI